MDLRCVANLLSKQDRACQPLKEAGVQNRAWVYDISHGFQVQYIVEHYKSPSHKFPHLL